MTESCGATLSTDLAAATARNAILEHNAFGISSDYVLVLAD